MSDASALLERLRRRPLPAWYDDAKLGIFVHWGLAAVPGWAPRTGSIVDVLRGHYHDLFPLSPYADWYENAIKFPESPSAKHHAAVHGGAPYAAFRETFLAGLEHWDPAAWAELFRQAGARYVVLVTRHHDGFCLWPTRVPHPRRRRDWRCERDLVGELAAAVRARGLRFGVYYSGGIDWSFDPRPVRDFGELVASVPSDPVYAVYADAQLRELVEAVAPSVLWNDIAWPGTQDALLRLFRDYYQGVPDGVVNDRWVLPGRIGRLLRWRLPRALFNAAVARAARSPGGTPPAPPSLHWDFRTPEYASYPELRREKWESTRGLGHSFAYNRNERDEDLIPAGELVRSFVDIVAKNGNLLLNVGPRGEDGAVPEIQAARLRALGAWLARNGEAIHGTRPWLRAEGTTRGGAPVRFTRRDEVFYALLLDAPEGTSVVLRDVRTPAGSRVELLGEGPVAWIQEGPDLRIQLRAPLRGAPVHAFKIAPPAARPRPEPAH